jgi:hypothetical protein
MFRYLENVVENAMRGLDDLIDNSNDSNRNVPNRNIPNRHSDRSSRPGPARTAHRTTTTHRNGDTSSLESQINHIIEQNIGPMEETIENMFNLNGTGRRNHRARHEANHARAQAASHNTSSRSRRRPTSNRPSPTDHHQTQRNSQPEQNQGEN